MPPITHQARFRRTNPVDTDFERLYNGLDDDPDGLLDGLGDVDRMGLPGVGGGSGARRLDAAELDESMARECRATGVSLVAGQRIDVRHLLGSFVPAQNVVEDVQSIEMVAPMVRPYGCGPVAPHDWVVLRTYNRIAEMREGVRMDDNGVTLSDRDFKRFYQTARAAIEPSMTIKGRMTAIELAFRPMLDKCWHRYMFPFGTFAYVAPSAGAGKSETDYRDTLRQGLDPRQYINPYSVALADVLYLCNTAGYLERFVYTIGILLWAKRESFNLLHHRRYRGRDVRRMSRLDMFLTLEKHLHVFGSIWLHLHVMQSNKQQVGGNWNEMMLSLETLGRELMAEFNVDRELVEARVKDMTLRTLPGSLDGLTRFFRGANRVADAK